MLRSAFAVLYLIRVCSGSIQFEAKLVDNFRPSRCFSLDDGCKLLRRVADHVASEFIEPFAQAVPGDAFQHLVAWSRPHLASRYQAGNALILT